MDPAQQIREVLSTEILVHRALLRLARTRHVLLRQGRTGEAGAIGLLEAVHHVARRDLEGQRARLMASAPVAAQASLAVLQHIAALARSLSAVERANQALMNQALLAVLHTFRPLPAPSTGVRH
jgi:hypothetical protein